MKFGSFDSFQVLTAWKETASSWRISRRRSFEIDSTIPSITTVSRSRSRVQGSAV
ncbi:MAG: hypothetical protein L3K13_06750 [Thermoplasmata archaeon]|nr:hypothetical protein [Thermoplasmata archaeon]